MATRKVALDEIVGLQRYEEIRDDFRRRTIDLKRQRRVSVGDRVTFVFENHETMLFQIQEMLRAERIVDLDGIRSEIEVYNTLIPDPGELSATMLIEITESSRIRDELVSLIGIDEAVCLQVGPYSIPAEFEAGRSKEDKLSAVQYVRFKFPEAARQAFLNPKEKVRLVIEHLQYQRQSELPEAVRQSLAEDLR
ncbi:MAG: DUF3501 family protein [Deltaproteobacteria bacterium]|nr:DUF3501 family protein [Deltaproteobacteria bacterium]